MNAQLVELGQNIIARLDAVDPGESVSAQILTLIEQRNALFDACSTALDALDGFDPLMDDESRATAYADELKAGFAAKDQLRSAMAKYLNR